MKIYKVIHKRFGWSFSFNATDEDHAWNLLMPWITYHGFNKSDYSIKETTDTDKMHNEWVN